MESSLRNLIKGGEREAAIRAFLGLCRKSVIKIIFADGRRGENCKYRGTGIWHETCTLPLRQLASYAAERASFALVFSVFLGLCGLFVIEMLFHYNFIYKIIFRRFELDKYVFSLGLSLGLLVVCGISLTECFTYKLLIAFFVTVSCQSVEPVTSRES